MNLIQWEDLCVDFDTYGMQPSTLCEDEEGVINYFRNGLKEGYRNLEILEILKRCFKFDNEFVIFLLKCNFYNVITNDELLKIEGWRKS